jgi:hypothetical protein
MTVAVVVAAALGAWAGFALLVTGLCAMAARGDRAEALEAVDRIEPADGRAAAVEREPIAA